MEKYLEKKLVQVDAQMKRLLKTEEPSMKKIINWMLKEKGKQLRPRMLLTSAAYCNPDADATELAAMVEIVHMATLVHDDVIDQADTRRGRMSVQKKFGMKAAIYTGDFMLFSMMYHSSVKVDDKYRELLHTMNKLCNGELGQNSNVYNTNMSIDTYIENIEGKTASMFELAAKAGVTVCDGSEFVKKQMAEFGKNFGILFQIQDDLLDIVGDEKSMGKPNYQDFANGIYTLPVLLALRHKDGKKGLLQIKDKVKKEGMNEKYAGEITGYLQQTNAFEKSMEIINGFYEKARKSLEHLDNTRETQYFSKLLEQVYENISNMCNRG